MMEKIKWFIFKRKYIINNKFLERKSKKARKIYIVAGWISYGYIEMPWTGKFNKNGDPLIIYYTDCNGTKDLYYVTEWYRATTGFCKAYFFNEQEAHNLAEEFNRRLK